MIYLPLLPVTHHLHAPTTSLHCLCPPTVTPHHATLTHRSRFYLYVLQFHAFVGSPPFHGPHRLPDALHSVRLRTLYILRSTRLRSSGDSTLRCVLRLIVPVTPRFSLPVAILAGCRSCLRLGVITFTFYTFVYVNFGLFCYGCYLPHYRYYAPAHVLRLNPRLHHYAHPRTTARSRTPGYTAPATVTLYCGVGPDIYVYAAFRYVRYRWITLHLLFPRSRWGYTVTRARLPRFAYRLYTPFSLRSPTFCYCDLRSRLPRDVHSHIYECSSVPSFTLRSVHHTHTLRYTTFYCRLHTLLRDLFAYLLRCTFTFMPR